MLFLADFPGCSPSDVEQLQPCFTARKRTEAWVGRKKKTGGDMGVREIKKGGGQDIYLSECGLFWCAARLTRRITGSSPGF